MPSTLSIVFPPSPAFTDADLPSLAGKVYIVTGAASGVGFELAKMLYAAGGSVYIAARSTARCNGAIDKIETGKRGSRYGKLEAKVIDLADLRTVRGAVEEFMKKESRLDLLVHNAGVMTPSSGSKDELVGTLCMASCLSHPRRNLPNDNWHLQGHDLEIAVHCLAPYLLTALLEPVLLRTAAIMPKFSVRVVFVVSILQQAPDTMLFDSRGSPKVLPKAMDYYMKSKIGEAWIAAEFAKRLQTGGVRC